MKNLLIVAIFLLSTVASTFAQNPRLSVITVNKSIVSIPKFEGVMKVTIISLNTKNTKSLDDSKFDSDRNVVSDGVYEYTEYSNKLDKGDYKIIVVKDGKTTTEFFTIK